MYLDRVWLRMIVHSFTNTSEALADIQIKCREKVSVVITDILMPVHNGFEIARKTREIIQDVPIVFMTAFEMHPSEFEKVFPSLADVDLLQKPFHIDKLLKIVRKYHD